MRFPATLLATVLAVVAIVLAACAATLLGAGGSGSVDALLEGRDLPLITPGIMVHGDRWNPATPLPGMAHAGEASSSKEVFQ